MICLVTGAAGFIGSHLSQRLLEEKYKVIGVDSFTDFYPKWIKEKNISALLKRKNFEFIPQDLNKINLQKILQKTDSVFHLAAQAGVRTSWGKNFFIYTKNNIDATQKLLEASKNSHLKKLIYASSSSVYGFTPELPMSEASPLRPFSPYGVTKLAAENLCFLYQKNFGIPTVSLRFFTVYGPRQRPDMAFHKFFCALKDDRAISLYGDGSQTRDFTFIDDAINATFRCLVKGKVGEIYNIGGGDQIKIKDIFPLLEEISQKRIKLHYQEKQRGDVPHTFANIDKAKRDLGYSPQTRIQDGLHEEWKWLRNLYSQ